MKISSKASRYISSRRGETRFAPYSLKNKFGNSDQMYIDNAQSKKRLNKPGSSTVGGKANNRFQDLDYSYERMQMSDRLLDMNPAPPPYSDTIIRWDLDVNPQVPVPQFTFDAYEDPDKDEPIPPTEQKEMTKEEWEAAFKNNDKGTYDLYLYTNYYLYTDGKYHVMDEGTYDFFSKYMHFEDNYTYENPWFSKDTPFKLVEFKNETEGIVYMQFHFLKDGEEYYFSMPVDTYDPRNGGEASGNEGSILEAPFTTDQYQKEYYDSSTNIYSFPEDIFPQLTNANSTIQLNLNNEQLNWMYGWLRQNETEYNWNNNYKNFGPNTKFEISYSINDLNVSNSRVTLNIKVINPDGSVASVKTPEVWSSEKIPSFGYQPTQQKWTWEFNNKIRVNNIWSNGGPWTPGTSNSEGSLYKVDKTFFPETYISKGNSGFTMSDDAWNWIQDFIKNENPTFGTGVFEPARDTKFYASYDFKYAGGILVYYIDPTYPSISRSVLIPTKQIYVT